VILSPGSFARAQGRAPEIPLVPGLTIVMAMHTPKAGGARIAAGDYEMVITVGDVSPSAVIISTQSDAQDGLGEPLHLNIERRISRADLTNSRMQILGFHTDDPAEIAGTTALGPSLAVMKDLRTSGHAVYSVRNFRQSATSTGTLSRSAAAPVSFPVLVNGHRVELPTIRVAALLKYGDMIRPWEMLLLDHPQHPITLRLAVGAVGATIPFNAEATREIVRIDFPVAGNREIEDALSTQCRFEVPGIYFDFNRATLNSQSNAALKTIADLLRRQPQWRLGIEGHTDNVGSDSYNNDLSTRRAAAVKSALVGDFGVAADRLSSAGFGARRPVETNDTIAGRARNRRVELVRDCARAR
jgi:outer membrane protein OmpA-like peptidoglycan-associated protein